MKNPYVFICIFILFFCNLLSGQIVLPWSEGFENVAPITSFNADKDSINGLYDWSYNSTSPSRLRFSAGSGFYHSGNHAATLDLATDWSSTTHSITVKLDLSLYRNSTDLVLSFYYMDHADGSDPDDCVKIKTGSSSEYKIYNLNPGSKTDGVWNYVEIDLDQVFSSNGLYPHAETYIIFSQTGKKRALTTIAEGGITFDDISITGSMPQVLLPWIEDFEGIKDEMSITSNRTSVNGRGNISFQKTLNGRLRFNAGSSYCRSGSRAATLDCDAYNSSLPQNMMIMTLNMSRYVDYEDLELRFFYMHHGEEPHIFDNVYIRGSSGDTWILAYDLYANRAAAGTWKEASGIDIDALISGAGQTITSTFQIGFSQQDDYPTSTTTGQDGISIDDVRITTNDKYWLGNKNTNFCDNDNWWPEDPGYFNYSSGGILPLRTIVLDSTRYAPQLFNYPRDTTFYFYYLIVEELATFGVQNVSSNFFSIEINSDLINYGTLEINPEPLSLEVRVDGDIINNGILHIAGNDPPAAIGPFYLLGDFINNSDCGGISMGSIIMSGNSLQRISGSETSVFNNLFIQNSYSLLSCELTCATNALVIENYLELIDGTFEINSGANIDVGNIIIHNDAGLNLNDGNINCLIRGSLFNDNVISSYYNGLVTATNTDIILDVSLLGNVWCNGKSYQSPFLILGNDTHAGSDINNLTIDKRYPESDICVFLWTDLLIKNKLNLVNGKIKIMDENLCFPYPYSNSFPKVIVENTVNQSIETHNSSSYIVGNLRRYVTAGSYDFPVGSLDNYELVTLDLSSTSGGLTYLDAKFTSTSEERPPEGLEVNGSEITEFLNSGFWTINADAGSAEYDITLVSRGHSNGGFEPAQHAVFKRSGVGDWESLGIHDNSTQSGSESEPIYATRYSLTGFSDFIIGKNDIPFPLPVVLTSFTADCRGDEVVLSWQTESELNNDGFFLEKSNNGVDFYEISFSPGCGNCNNPSNYEMVDNEIDENAYYRLKQIDYDGVFTYSDIVSSNCGANKVNVFCRIKDGVLNVDFSSCNKNKYQLELYDNAGKMVFRNLIPDDYNQHYNYFLPSLSSGIYYLNIYNKNEFYSQKVNLNNF